MMSEMFGRLGRRHGISTSNFYYALCKTMLRIPLAKSQRVLKLTIGVSGGVDSMALAALCADLKNHPPANYSHDLDLYAIIVDHKAREGSELEAIIIKEKLGRMGIPSRIIPIEWPPGVRPLDLPDFETQARRLRYRALGSACRDHGCAGLLLAHHGDDQAETIFMRLASGHQGIGLLGMQSFAEIPECWGMHGIKSSGYRDRRASTFIRQKGEHVGPITIKYYAGKVRNSNHLFEHGGIWALRPLLKFKKQDLIDTCLTHGVEWVEDSTNEDVWRTPRNAVRSLMRNSTLPRALERDTLINIARRMQLKKKRHKAYAEKLYKYSKVLLFDIRSGGLVIRLPSYISAELLVTGEHRVQEIKSFSKNWTASLLIERLMALVTPYEEVSLHRLRIAVETIFPERRYDAEKGRVSILQRPNFTVGGVQFQRLDLPLLDSGIHSILGSNEESHQQQQDLDPDIVWSLSRQPYSRAPASTNPSKSVDAPPRIAISQGHPLGDQETWSTWHLWDGRYWIRIRNHTTIPIEIRSLCESDMKAIRATSSKAKMKTFEEVLASAAPGKVRWTLLAIVETASESPNAGRVLALPTLGKAGMIDVEDEKGERRVEWEISYKIVDLRVTQEDGPMKADSIITTWEES